MAPLESFAEFAEKHPGFPVRSLRHIDEMSRLREFNGKTEPRDPKYAKFASAFVRIGRRVYVDSERFFEIARDPS